MVKRKCENCQYWYSLPLSSGDRAEGGECRINPPLLHRAKGKWEGQFRLSSSFEWCGAHVLGTNDDFRNTGLPEH